MSVNYECVVMHGWEIPVELQETINKLTDYKYEDSWWYPDGYYDYSESVFLGDYITGIPLGTAMSLPELSKEVAQKTMRIDGFPFDEVRLELANHLGCYKYIENEPLVYIVNSVT